MSTFLQGLGTLLGGFRDVRLQNQLGPDWRQQLETRRLQNEATQQGLQQGAENYAIGQATDVLAGQPGVPSIEDVASQLPGQIDQGRRRWLAQVALGRLPERKSSIEAAKAYNRYQQDLLRGAQRAQEIGLRGDEAQDLARLRSKLETDQPLTQAEQARLDAYNRRTGVMAGRAGRGGGGAPKMYWNTETNNPEALTPDQLLNAPPGRFIDVTTGRQRATGGQAAQSTKLLIENVDNMLKRYENTQKGLGRFIPAQASPEKYVAWNAYQNALQTTAQLVGRTILGDYRVSEKDREAYANAIGATSQFITVVDPTEARRRLDLLKRLEADATSGIPIERSPAAAEAAAIAAEAGGAPGGMPGGAGSLDPEVERRLKALGY